MPPPANRPTPAHDQPRNGSVAHLLTRIIALIEQIIAVNEEEIPLIEARKRIEHAELLKRKQRLTLDYRASLKAIVLEPHLLRDVPEELRARARDAAERLAESSGRNARALRSVITACQRLVQSIVAIVKDEVLPKTGYGKSSGSPAGGGYSPTCKPVTVYKSV